MFVVWAACQTFGTQIGLTEKDVPANDWGAVTDNAQVSIMLYPVTNVITINQNSGFIARIKNLSTNEEFGVYVEASFLLSPGISFNIISPSGKDVSPIFSHAIRLTGDMVWVHPGKIDGFIIDLQQFCKLDELGTYKITMTIQRESLDRQKLYNVVSNPLYVTVIPAQ